MGNRSRSAHRKSPSRWRGKDEAKASSRAQARSPRKKSKSPYRLRSRSRRRSQQRETRRSPRRSPRRSRSAHRKHSPQRKQRSPRNDRRSSRSQHRRRSKSHRRSKSRRCSKTRRSKSPPQKAAKTRNRSKSNKVSKSHRRSKSRQRSVSRRAPKAVQKERSKSRHRSKPQQVAPKVRDPSPSPSPSPSPPPKAAPPKKQAPIKDSPKRAPSSATDLSDSSSSSEDEPPPAPKNVASKKPQVSRKRSLSSSDETSLSTKKKPKAVQKHSSQAAEKPSKQAKRSVKQKDKPPKQPAVVEKKANQKKIDKKSLSDTKKSKGNGNLDDIDANFGHSVVAAACAGKGTSSSGDVRQVILDVFSREKATASKHRAGKPVTHEDRDSDATDIEGVMSDADSSRKAALAPPPPLPAPAPLPATLPLQPPTLLDLAQKRKKKKKKKDVKQGSHLRQENARAIFRSDSGALHSTAATISAPASLPVVVDIPEVAERTSALAETNSDNGTSVAVVGENSPQRSPQDVVADPYEDVGADSREALAQRFVATQKELLRLQLEAKARQLARLKKQLQMKQVRTTRGPKASPAPVMLPPHLAAAVLPASKASAPRPVARPGKNRFASKQWIASKAGAANSGEGSRRALRGVVEKHQEKVRAQREQLEEAQRRRRMLGANISPKKADEVSTSCNTYADEPASGNYGASGGITTRIIATPSSLVEAVALCKAAYDSSMANNVASANQPQVADPNGVIIDVDDDEMESTAASSSQLPVTTQ